MATSVTSIRIDSIALDVLEWHARMTGYPLRARIRAILEAEAEAISERFDLPSERTPP